MEEPARELVYLWLSRVVVGLDQDSTQPSEPAPWSPRIYATNVETDVRKTHGENKKPCSERDKVTCDDNSFEPTLLQFTDPHSGDKP